MSNHAGDTPPPTDPGTHARHRSGAPRSKRTSARGDAHATASVQTFIDRNRRFADSVFDSSLKMRPSAQTVVISCFDPRVDAGAVLGAKPGEVGVIRNVGGRVTYDVLRELIALQQIARSAGSDLGPGWTIIVLQHTDCGITRIHDRPELLAPYFEIERDRLGEKAITDPPAAVIEDVAALRADEHFAGVTIAGLVYDVATGLVELVAA